jgi:hypothetical protein
MNEAHPKPSSKSGQTLTEFMVTAGVILASVVVLSLFLYTFKEYGGRILDLVALDYP